LTDTTPPDLRALRDKARRERTGHQATFDPAEHRSEKARARKQDDDDLAAGIVTPQELNRRNGLFSSVDLSKATVRRRNPKGKL